MESLDKLTDATTAMQTWARLEESMRGGYVPTIRPDTRRKRLLIRVCRAMGFRVFTGFRAGRVRGRRASPDVPPQGGPLPSGRFDQVGGHADDPREQQCPPDASP